jgi:hypothetical protein
MKLTQTAVETMLEWWKFYQFLEVHRKAYGEAIEIKEGAM